MTRSLIQDLLQATEQVREQTCDVCVIGAGAAGIFLATELAARGRSIVLLEAGGVRCASGAAVGFDVDLGGSSYGGATEGRAFGLGGSTSRWGGLLACHTRRDLRTTDTSDDTAWQTIVEAVGSWKKRVLHALGVGNATPFEPYAQRMLGARFTRLASAGVDVDSTLYLPFRRKNFANILQYGEGFRTPIITICNAVATSWETPGTSSDGAQFSKLTAKARNGRRLIVQAQHYVIAAGALESARIILEIDSAWGQKITPPTASVGSFLGDHLSVPIAVPETDAARDIVRVFGPRFERGRLRSYRLLEAKPSRETPRAFGHFLFENASPGFAAVKELLGAFQRKSRPELSVPDLVSGCTGMVGLAWGRFARSVLHIPAGTPTRFQLDIEQAPVRENRIELTGILDAHGRRLPAIRWTIAEKDRERIRNVAASLLLALKGRLAEFPRLVPLPYEATCSKPHDAYHPVGTCRMGTDGQAVVDLRLRVKGTANLWVASTAVFPTAGTANPTFSLLCLTASLADRLDATLPGGKYV